MADGPIAERAKRRANIANARMPLAAIRNADGSGTTVIAGLTA
jgi:hypothetical protein